jgi:hypothetical protein
MTTLREAAQQALEALLAAWQHNPHWQTNESITALKAALEQPTECWWFQDGDEDSGNYMASCNQRYFVLEDGTPKDNRMTHCCYCGKRLVEVPIDSEDNP